MAKDDDLRSDIAAAKQKMRVRLGAGREIKRLTEYLLEGEVVDHMTTGTQGKGTGLVVLTDRRLLFVKDGLTSRTSEGFPIDLLASVQWTPGRVAGSIVILASGVETEIKNVYKEDGDEIVDEVRRRMAEPPAFLARPSDATAAAADPLELLRKLGELRDSGVVTAEEFDAKKAEILGRL